MKHSVDGRRPIRCVVVFGTRPEAIKLLPVIRAMQSDVRFQVRVIATGQHREMVDQILRPFGVTPDRDLGIMQPGQTLNQIVCRAMPKLDRLYDRERPDLVVVQGDTTSAFCAALAAFHRRIPVAHVEAGLRSFDRGQPYPEETNRRMISSVVDLHFAPTVGAAENLLREGVRREDVVVTGNTAVDTLLLTLSAPPSADPGEPDAAIPGPAQGGPLVLITLHRRENWQQAVSHPAASTPASGETRAPTPMEQIFEAIRLAAEEHPAATFVYPMHLNPRVREPAQRILGATRNVRLIDPQPYASFVRLMARSTLILTDSGGIQEEAPSLGVPLLILRETTERPEAVSEGTNLLLGTSPQRIRDEIRHQLRRPIRRLGHLPFPNPYGDGLAHQRISQSILYLFGLEAPPEEFGGAFPGLYDGDKDVEPAAVFG